MYRSYEEHSLGSCLAGFYLFLWNCLQLVVDFWFCNSYGYYRYFSYDESKSRRNKQFSFIFFWIIWVPIGILGITSGYVWILAVWPVVLMIVPLLDIWGQIRQRDTPP